MTAPTLPAMTTQQIRAIAIAAGCTEDDDGALVSALVIGAAAARDAQWAARLDAAVRDERARFMASSPAAPTTAPR